MQIFELFYVRFLRFIFGIKLTGLHVEIFHFYLLLLDFHRALTNVFLLFLDYFVFFGDRIFELIIQLLKFEQSLPLFGVDLLEDFPEAVRFFVDLLCLRVFG